MLRSRGCYEIYDGDCQHMNRSLKSGDLYIKFYSVLSSLFEFSEFLPFMPIASYFLEEPPWFFSALHRRNVGSWIQRCAPRWLQNSWSFKTRFEGQVFKQLESWNPYFLIFFAQTSDLFSGQKGSQVPGCCRKWAWHAATFRSRGMFVYCLWHFYCQVGRPIEVCKASVDATESCDKIEHNRRYLEGKCHDALPQNFAKSRSNHRKDTEWFKSWVHSAASIASRFPCIDSNQWRNHAQRGASPRVHLISPWESIWSRR